MAKIVVRGKVFGDGDLPMICTPLVGKDLPVIMSELHKVVPKNPDLVEWRVDFFKDIGDIDEVVRAAKSLRDSAGEIPILFTVRSQKEGGQPITLSDGELVQLYEAVCNSRFVDMIDFELSKKEEHMNRVKEAAGRNGIKLIGSFHDFSATPGQDVLKAKFALAESIGVDIVKVAVMPRNLEDVLALLEVTLEGRKMLRIPLITMSMGGPGSLTRMFGWVFGSALTFAVGENSSAPGQVPIEDLRTVLNIVQKSLGE